MSMPVVTNYQIQDSVIQILRKLQLLLLMRQL